MTDIDIVEPEVVVMLQKFAGHRRSITRSAAIYHDLRIAGDDVSELFDMITARFGTSFEGLYWPTYFPNETQIGPVWWLAERLGHHETKWRHVTVGHLLAVIARGSWFDTVESA